MLVYDAMSEAFGPFGPQWWIFNRSALTILSRLVTTKGSNP